MKYGFPFTLVSDTSRKIGLAYGACDNLDDGSARRIAYVIDGEGRIEEAHPRVHAASYPSEQLSRLAERAP